MTAAEREARQELQAGRPEQAERILRNQLAARPGDAALRALLAQVLATLGRKDEAIAELEVVVAQSPEARPLRLLLARLANERGRSALAERHARFLADMNPADSEAWSALGF